MIQFIHLYFVFSFARKNSFSYLLTYFFLWFDFTCLILDCGGMLEITSDIVIKSQDYRLLLYDPNYLCSWYYYSDRKFDVSIELEMSATSCTTAKVEFHQEADKNTPFTTFCQNTNVALRNLDSLLIVFKSHKHAFFRMFFKASFNINRQTPETTVAKTNITRTVASSTASVSTSSSSVGK